MGNELNNAGEYKPTFVPAAHKKRSIHVIAYPVLACFFGIMGIIMGAAINGSPASSAGQNAKGTVTPASTIKPNKAIETPHKVPVKPAIKKYGSGFYEVGVDIKAGKYKSVDNSALCYWARTSSLEDEMAIKANHLGGGDLVVVIKKTDKGFKTSGCNEWVLAK
jgi:hypothetical protein